MKKTNYLPLLFLFALLSKSLFAQQNTPVYVLRLVPVEEKKGDKLAQQALDAAISALHKSNRVDVITDPNDKSTASSHLLEAGSSQSVLVNEFQIKKHIDSTQTIVFNYSYVHQGKVEMLAVSVETGQVAGTANIVAKGEASKEFSLKYSQVGWAKGKDPNDEKTRNAVLARARAELAKQLPPLYKAGQDAMIANMGALARTAHASLFPYRALVTEVAEAKGEKAKAVKIEAGKALDLQKNDRMVIYTVREITAGDKVYEHFEMLGSVSADKLNDKDGLFDVDRGKKEVMTAMSAKKKVYASPGGKPYTVAKSGSGLNISIASFVVPKTFTPKNRQDAYRRLRFNLMGKLGYNLLERQNLSALNNEKELQKHENFIDKAVIDQFKAVGADLLLEVVCSEVVFDIKRNWDTNKAGSAKISIDYLLRLVSVETGEVMGEKKVPFSKYYADDATSPDEVLAQYNQSSNPTDLIFLEDALKSFNINPAAFLDEMLPPKIIVAEVTDEKKDRADEVLVVGDFDFKALDKWNVVRKKVINVEGKDLIRFEPIGVVSFREDQGEGVANAKVKDGGEQILTAIRAGEVLYVMDKPNWAERWNSSYLYKHGY